MTTAWYTPQPFSPIPVGRSSQANSADPPSRPIPSSGLSDVEDDPEEDKEGIIQSVEYLCTLIDKEVERGVSLQRIVIGGFSQGCAVSLVAALGSRYASQVAGIVGLSGYLPIPKYIKYQRHAFQERERSMSGVRHENDGRMRVFLAHGTKDMLVPVRIYRETKERIEKMLGQSSLEGHEYDGLGHVSCGAEFRDMCAFLEKAVPA
jgi:predicted esterase